MQDVFTVFRLGTWRVRFQLVLVWTLGTLVIALSLWCIAKIILIAMDFRHAPKEAIPITEVVAPFTHSFELKDISFPMLSKGKNRVMYARFSLTLDCPSAEAKGEIEKGRSRVIDTILEVTSKFYEEDFRTNQGFAKLKEDLTRALAQRFANGPRQVSISDWTIG